MANELLIVKSPRGAVFKIGKSSARLDWNPNFKPKWQGKYNAAQKYVDQAVLDDTEQFVPLKTGALIFSGKLMTIIGSGSVIWKTPYARIRYYLPGRREGIGGSLRGAFWFERSKAVNKSKWISGAKARMR